MRTPDCARCEELLLDWLYGELDDATSASVAAHLEGCESCSARASEWRRTMQALDSLRDEAAPAGAAEDAREALAREMLLERPAPSRLPRRIFGVALAAAAMLALVVGIRYFVVPGAPPATGGGSGGANIARIGTPPGAPPGVRPNGMIENILRGREAWADTVVLRESYELTVFNEDLALVKDKRRIVNLREGENIVKFTDVASMIDPTSVRFESATDPATTKVLEQNYEFDLATPDALLKKYIDKKIACVTKDGQIVEGYLASYDMGAAAAALEYAGQSMAENDEPVVVQERYAPEGQMMVVNRRANINKFVPPAPGSIVLTADPGKGATSIVSRDDLTAVRLPEMPAGLLVKPTLVWKVGTKRSGPHDTTLTYQSRGFSWNADYVVTVGAGDILDWAGWVTINNNSGTSYPDTKLKLIAGEVHRVQEAPDSQGATLGLQMRNAAKGEDRGGKAFEEKAFFEYHLYTLSEPTTLNNQQTKQLKLMKADGTKAARRYIFDANRNPSRALVELEVWNKKENNLGMPLPKGRVRFRQADPDGDLEYIGEDAIEHTPKDEKLTLDIGAAFDVTGERVMTNQSSSGRQSTQSFVITLRNHKPAPVRVIVREHPGGGQWAVIVQSTAFSKIDQTTLEFPVDVPANSETQVSYTIRYTW